MLENVPDDLKDGPVSLRFEEIVRLEGHSDFVPYYHFKVIDGEGAVVGHVNFRVGDTPHVQVCAG
ncbi:MAG: GNAT family N-acetyltransferase, partial [Planctomycetota bacterium]